MTSFITYVIQLKDHASSVVKSWVTSGWIADLIQDLSIPTSYQKPIINFAWIYGDKEEWQWSNLLHMRLRVFEPPAWSYIGFFDNAGFFIRCDLPVSLYIQIRWSRNRLVQFGGFWKERGQFGPIFRIQTDASSQKGYTASNPWEVSGWKDGPH